MVLCDVNVLVHAHRRDAKDHVLYQTWLEDLVDGEGACAASELVLSGFLRIVTSHRVFKVPTPMASALQFVERIVERDTCVLVRPGPRHRAVFPYFCRSLDPKGNVVPDACFADLAME